MNQIIKLKIYVNKTQSELIRQSLGNVRFVWNRLLEIQSDRLRKKEKLLSFAEMCREITKMKKEYEFLNQSSIWNLQQIARKLDFSLKQWRKKKQKYPRFKRKKYFDGILIFPRDFKIKGKYLNIPKIGKVKIKDRITKNKEKWDYIKDHIKQVLIKESVDGFFAYLLYEIEQKQLQLDSNKTIGIDVGIRNTITLSNNTKYKIDLEKIKKLVKKIEKLQSIIDKKKHINKKRGIRNSKELERVKLKQLTLFQKIKNIKDDFYHKITTYIVKNHDYIGIEDINLNQIQQNNIAEYKKANKRFHKLLGFTSLSTFTNKLEYKALREGKVLVKVNPKYTSKRCSCCGYLNKDLSKDTKFKCPNCGLEVDRDLNASINIEYSMVQHFIPAWAERDKGAEMGAFLHPIALSPMRTQ